MPDDEERSGAPDLEQAAEQAARSLQDEIVPDLKEGLAESGGKIVRNVASILLSQLVGWYEGQMQGYAEVGDLSAFEDTVLASIDESGDGPQLRWAGGAKEKLTEWRETPPERLQKLVAVRIGADPSKLEEDGSIAPEEEAWGRWAEWAAHRAFEDIAEDIADYIADDDTPAPHPEDEWQALAKKRGWNWTGDYLGDTLQLLVPALARLIADDLTEAFDGAPSPREIEGLLGVEVDEADAPAPRPETPDHDPDPFTGPNETAGLLADPFSNAVRGALMDAQGEPAESKVGEWGIGPRGAPVRVEKLKNPYEGRAVLKVQAHADADPAEVEAAMGWEMLERMDMDTVWLHSVLLAHASAPHRRGNRETMTIPRRRVENALGIRQNRNMNVRERAERVKKHVEALQSLYVQFQGVRRHGKKLHFEGDMTASPLWFVQMKARGQKDLFTGEVTADWHLKAKEGVWGSEFLHNHGDQWAPLPKEWFDQIDRRGKDWTQRLAVALLFLFRINAKRGGVVKLSAGKMLEVCAAGTGGRKQRKTERKRRLSSALDALRDRYGIGVQAERVHMRHAKNIAHEDWRRRVATFTPPDSIDGELLRNESEGRPPLPEVKGGNWTKDQIKQLRSDLGWSQTEMADFLDVSQGYVSQLESGRSKPSGEKCKLLDRLDSRHR